MILALAWPAALWLHERRVHRVLLTPCQTIFNSLSDSCNSIAASGGTVVTKGGKHVVARITSGPDKGDTFSQRPHFVRIVSSLLSRPSWEDPAALGIALGSLALAVGVVAYRRF